MAIKVIDIKCPNCRDSVDTGQKTCKYCKQPIIISTFNSVYEMTIPMINKYDNAYRQALSGNPEDKELNNSVAMCYLKLKLYILNCSYSFWYNITMKKVKDYE